jgi:hypothetical protein
LPDEENKDLEEKLKKELAKLEWEEQLLKKRDDRLKWEQEMLKMEDGLKKRGESILGNKPTSTEELSGSTQPVSEPTPTVKPPEANVELESGGTYLLLEPTPQRSVDLFINEVKGGMGGLYITRSNPNQVKKKFDLGTSKICWLTGVRSSENMLSISGLQELSILISNTIDENNKSVILLDGVEYLVSNNDFSIVLRLVQQIRDKVSTSESKMLIPLNPNALDARQLTLLQRECHTIT